MEGANFSCKSQTITAVWLGSRDPNFLVLEESMLKMMYYYVGNFLLIKCNVIVSLLIKNEEICVLVMFSERAEVLSCLSRNFLDHWDITLKMNQSSHYTFLVVHILGNVRAISKKIFHVVYAICDRKLK